MLLDVGTYGHSLDAILKRLGILFSEKSRMMNEGIPNGTMVSHRLEPSHDGLPAVLVIARTKRKRGFDEIAQRPVMPTDPGERYCSCLTQYLFGKRQLTRLGKRNLENAAGMDDYMGHAGGHRQFTCPALVRQSGGGGAAQDLNPA